MKLIIQIPSYNEEQTITQTINAISRNIPGVDEVKILVINDGSTDNTVETAKQAGADYIYSLPKNSGLAYAFSAGLEEALRLNADIIVNIDADNQYNADDIGILIKPILENKADIAIGARPIVKIKHFSPIKKLLQKLGSFVMRKVSYTTVEDAPSGFRAFSREAAMKLNIFDNYTYTLETIIQASAKNLTIVNVPIRVNGETRPSRLFKNIYVYIKRSIFTMLRIFIIYRPFRFFATLGVALFAAGFLLAARFLYFYLIGEGTGHIQSLILASLLMTLGFQTGLLGVIADLLAINRKLSEDIQLRIKKLENGFDSKNKN